MASEWGSFRAIQCSPSPPFDKSPVAPLDKLLLSIRASNIGYPVGKSWLPNIHLLSLNFGEVELHPTIEHIRVILSLMILESLAFLT